MNKKNIAIICFSVLICIFLFEHNKVKHVNDNEIYIGKRDRLDKNVVIKKMNVSIDSPADIHTTILESYDDIDVSKNRESNQELFEDDNYFNKDLFCKPAAIDYCKCSDEFCSDMFQYSRQALDSISNYEINYDQFGDSIDGIISDISQRTGKDEYSVRKEYDEKIEEIYSGIKCIVSSPDQCFASDESDNNQLNISPEDAVDSET